MAVINKNPAGGLSAAFWLIDLLLGCCSPLVAKSARQMFKIFGGKKGLKTSFNSRKKFCLDIFLTN